MTQDDYAEAWAWVHFLSETGPEHRGVLCEYLSDLRVQGSAEPLSERLRRRLAQPERALVEHVGAWRPPWIVSRAAMTW